ncbi:invasion associated locus B family protein [Paracoccus beibuensis]|uniref:invasion associated locus B family protein n=1 Tax=Paracoccus beibuensis TaxID=547602 RepID=UPI00223EB8F6|nr:invasion associated locus B family protein [Paracoccus beibuensis]
MIHFAIRSFCFFSLLAASTAQAQDAATCDAVTNRCTSMVRLVAEENRTFATLSLQMEKSGADPVLFVTAPLGIAARPGVRVVIDPGAFEIPLPLDACFPDGCRASTELTALQMSQLSEARTLSVQFIPFSSSETVAGDLEAASLISPLKQAGITLP